MLNLYWFVKIKSKRKTSDETVIDDYRNKTQGQSYFTVNHLQKLLTKKAEPIIQGNGKICIYL